MWVRLISNCANSWNFISVLLHKLDPSCYEMTLLLCHLVFVVIQYYLANILLI